MGELPQVELSRSELPYITRPGPNYLDKLQCFDRGATVRRALYVNTGP